MNQNNAENTEWSSLSYEEKNRLLFLRQKKTLDMFLERGAISRAQHDKSLHDLIEKMGMAAEGNEDEKRSI
ncbi:MAG: hypothetical protein IKF22_10040 [Lachnospiraceae bacterium]|nr:hypothetical protein [Lachnospiraceae bacterium]